MGKSILAILVLAFLGCAQAQVNAPGPCPAVELQPNFSVTGYLGKWYEYAKFAQSETKCIQAEYTPRTDGSMGIRRGEVNIKTNEPLFTDFYAEETQNADFKVIFPNRTSAFSVLETDYKRYRVTYFCKNLEDGTHNYSAWIAGRNRMKLSPKLYRRALAVLRKNKMDPKKLVKTIQNRQCDKLLQD